MKKKKQEQQDSPFDLYLRSLSDENIEKISEFFQEIHSHVNLPMREQMLIRSDFEKALLIYSELNVPLQETLRRLSYKNLGGFYVRPPILWYTLDDAAKIYPLSMRHGQMAVFRVSVYLKEDVVPELLQIALTFTIKRFPSFATTVKKGFFWHYLDTTKRRFVVEMDSGLLCRPMKIASSGSQSFRVIYYDNRISVEFFHVLTDGIGGITFLKTLTAEYLRLLGVSSSPSEGILDINDAPVIEETANEFSRAIKNDSASGFIDMPAVQMSGRLAAVKPVQILHFKMSSYSLSCAAKNYNATVTAYILAQMFLSGRFATDEFHGDMNIQVPVNMRKFYPSKTVRNFTMYCGIRLPIESITNAADIIQEVSRQLTEKSSQKSMSQMMCSMQNMIKAIRYIPLFIKAPVARIVYSFLGDKIFSNTLSNIGIVKFPPELATHINYMDFVLGAALTNRAGCSLVTCGDISILTVTKMTSDPSFEERLYELLHSDGIEITIEGSADYEN